MTAIEADWGKIILWIAIWGVGYVLGLAERAVKNKVKVKKSEEEIKFLKAQVDSFQPVQEISEPTSLSVFERENGALELRLDGEMLEHKSDLDSVKRARLLKLVIALRPWLDAVKTEKKPVPPSITSTTAQSVVSRPMTSPLGIKESPVAERVSKDLSYAHLNIAEQIDRILQEKLEGHPLEKRGISLHTAPSGGLLIRIGLNKYETIEKIPDKDIQQIIFEARDEWK